MDIDNKFNNFNIIIKNDVLSICTNLNLISKNLKLLPINHLKNYNFTDFINLIYIINNINNKDKNNLEYILKLLNDCHLKKDIILKYLKHVKINKILSIYHKMNEYNYIQQILKELIINYLHKLNNNDSKIKIIINYNINNIFDINYLNIDFKSKKYLYYVYNIINNKRLYKDHIIFNIDFHNICNSIYNRYFIRFKDKHLDLFKMLIHHNNIFTSKYILNKIIESDHSNFDYIFKVNENNMDNILDNYSNNELNIIISYDFLKYIVLNRYLYNNKYFNINVCEFIQYILYDNNISESIIKEIIIKDYNYNGILLINLYKFINMIKNDKLKYIDIINFVIYYYTNIFIKKIK